MTKKFKFLLFFIFILFISIASVSASDIDLNDNNVNNYDSINVDLNTNTQNELNSTKELLKDSNTVNVELKNNIASKSKVNIKDIISVSKNYKNYILKNSKLPSTVKINGVSYTNAQYTYLMALSILYINKGITEGEITLPTVKAATNPNGGFFYKPIPKSNYLKLAYKLVLYANKNHKLPNYVVLSSRKVGCDLCSYEFSKILSDYGENLPSKIILNSSVFINKPKDGHYALTCLKWGTGADITRNKVLMKNIKPTALAKKIILISRIGTPIIAFGNGKGPVVVINAGIHGNELSSQAACFRLIEKLASLKNIKGTIYVIPVIQPKATASNVRDYKGIKLNKLAGVEGTISNNLIRLSMAVGAKGLGDFHCTRHGGEPGKNIAMGSFLPNKKSATLAKYISSKAHVHCKVYKRAGASYPGAVEDEANIHGITSVTCEALTNPGTIEKNSVTISYAMMLSFLSFWKYA